MTIGDLVKIKERLKEDQVFIYSDDQMKRMEALIYLENYNPIRTKNQLTMNKKEYAIILGEKDIHKDSGPVDVVWNRFVKIISSSGKLGWIQRGYLTKVFSCD